MPAEPTPLRSEKTHFHMIPDWLPRAVSPRAYMLFGIMHGYSNKQTGLTFPSRSTLATDMRCTLPTVDATIKELLAAGAMTRAEGTRKNGSQTTNRYVLQFDQPTPPAPDEAPSPVKQALPESTVEAKPALLHPSSQLSPTRKVALAPITRSSELDPVNKSAPPAFERPPVSLMPKKTAITAEWLESIRPEWSPKLRDFDEVIAFAMNSEYLRKKPDKQAYILGQLKRAVAREASFTIPRTNVQRPRVIARPDDPNNFNNW